MRWIADRVRRWLLGVIVSSAACTGGGGSSPSGEPEWFVLLDRRDEASVATVAPAWSEVRFGGSGGVEESVSGVRLFAGSPLTGIAWPSFESDAIPTTPPSSCSSMNYEIEVEAARVSGTDFFCALTFPVGDAHLTLVLGGWGGSTCGFSCLDGRDASSNPTTRYRRFEKGRFVTARVRVTPECVDAFLDGEALCSTPLADVALSLRTEILPCQPLGIASYATTAQLRAVRWRPLADAGRR
ncbi:MAG: hypothetical protein EXS13_14710 [Planctomycetes bacterium]|nr:hypothetical protein [Planctomycetota bacterium]